MTANYNEDELGRLSAAAGVDATGKSYDQRTDAIVKHLRREPDSLPVASAWADMGYDPIPDPNNQHRQPQLIKHDGVYYVFHEHLTGTQTGGGHGNSWGIGVEWATSLAGPWTFVDNILPVSAVSTDPDYLYIADPSVLYIPWAQHPFHMWFDMVRAGGGYATSCIGHAYADDLLGPWTRQATGGVTDIVVSGAATTFGGYANFATHAPEAFLVGSTVHLLCNAYGTGHTTFDSLLYIANDLQGIGTSFEAWGPVTTDTTLTTGRAYRLQSPLVYDGVLYAILEDLNVSVFAFYWVSSTDNGKSWQEIGSSARAFHSFIVEGRKIIGISQAHGSVGQDDMRFWVLDLDNLTGTQLDADNIGTRSGLPMVHNVYKGYYANGDTDLYRDAAGIWRTSGKLVADGGLVTKTGITSARPASPQAGQMYFDTTIGKPIFYSGSAWVDAAGTGV